MTAAMPHFRAGSNMEKEQKVNIFFKILDHYEIFVRNVFRNDGGNCFAWAQYSVFSSVNLRSGSPAAL
jgi:hypothetical protein